MGPAGARGRSLPRGALRGASCGAIPPRANHAGHLRGADVRQQPRPVAQGDARPKATARSPRRGPAPRPPTPGFRLHQRRVRAGRRAPRCRPGWPRCAGRRAPCRSLRHGPGQPRTRTPRPRARPRQIDFRRPGRARRRTACRWTTVPNPLTAKAGRAEGRAAPARVAAQPAALDGGRDGADQLRQPFSCPADTSTMGAPSRNVPCTAPAAARVSSSQVDRPEIGEENGLVMAITPA